MSALKKPNVRTDLAVEAKNMYIDEENKQDADDVTVHQKKKGNIDITYVDVGASGAKHIGKKEGSYITIYTEGVKQQDTKQQEEASKILAKELKRLLKKHDIPSDSTGLIIGLGNWNVTPDALGPMSIDKVMVTNHLFELEHESVSEGYRPVAALSPGVMGVTGMDTSDIIFGITEKFKPDFLITVDALASRSVERVNETIQLSDTGIHPGSGVNNKRKEISKETIGVPVFAVGTPTVVDAVTITSDTIDFMLKHIGREWRDRDKPSKALEPAGLSFGQKKLTEEDLPGEDKRKAFLGILGTLSEEDKKSLIEEVLTPIGHNLMVTPKEVDGFMTDMATVIANGLNAAVHSRINAENFASYTR